MKNPRSKKSMVYETLKRKIINNSLKSGEPMNEATLAKELRISKTPIREALQQLKRDGFVENIPGRGAFVSKTSSPWSRLKRKLVVSSIGRQYAV